MAKVKLIVDTEKIKNLIWEYHAWRKDDREYASEAWGQEEIEIVLK